MRVDPAVFSILVWFNSKRGSSEGKNEPSEPRDLAGACSGSKFGNKFVVQGAAIAYNW
jgi:hypothetical protein